jgi:serine/threonine-protein kinase
MEPSPLFREPEYSVYKGEEIDTLQPVWVKEYHCDLLATGKWAELDRTLVLRDAVALASLGDHPNLVRYKTKIDTGDCVYVVLKREPGWFLRERMRLGQLTLKEKLHILSDLLDGLSHIHRHKEGKQTALYRDLRPESVFVTEAGRAQLFSFDCTRLPARSTALEQAKGRAHRWRAYASFELLNAEAPGQVGTPTDIYSWGVVAYELLAGQLPYADETKAAKRRYIPLAKLQLPISQSLATLIEQALSPTPWERPSLRDLQSVVQEALNGFR